VNIHSSRAILVALDEPQYNDNRFAIVAIIARICFLQNYNDRNNLTFFRKKPKSIRAFFAENESERFSLSTLVHSDLGLGRGLGDAVNLNVNLKIPRSREKEFRGKL
jgi:hypothetical protein